MNRTAAYLILLSLLITLTVSELFIIRSARTPEAKGIQVRRQFTKITGLPDLAVYSESVPARHRSFASAGDILGTGPLTPAADPAGFIYKWGADEP